MNKNRKPLLFIPHDRMVRICSNRIKISVDYDNLPLGKVAVSTKINNKQFILHGEIVKESWPTIDGDMYEYFFQVV